MLVSEILSKEEIQRFSKLSDWAALRVVGGNWLLIAGIFAVVATWTNPVTILLAIILLGGRQLSLDVIMHDAGHRSLFTRPSWNKFAAHYLAAPFTFGDAEQYRVKHNRHHRYGGTKEDPDLQNYVNYAVQRKSFLRKIARDLTGITGIKTLFYAAKAFGPKTVATWIIGNAILFGILYLTGNGILYLLWPTAFLTTHMLIVRIRQAAEHASVPDLFDPDPRKHTRTTYARWFERILLAPNNVNYHLEHHILPSVPCYRLPAFHQHLRKIGYLDTAELCHGYIQVIKKLLLPPGNEKQPAPVSS